MLLFKFTVKLTKPSQRHARSSVEIFLISDPNLWFPRPILQFWLKTIKKKHVIKTWFTWLVFISIFLCIFCIKFSWYIIYLQFTKIYPVSNILSWMLPSASAKISFAHSLLIFEAVFFFTMKISNSFC